MGDVGKNDGKNSCYKYHGHIAKTHLTLEFLCVMFYCVFVTFSYGVLGQV